MFDPTRPLGDGIAVLNLLSPSFFKHDVKNRCFAPSYVFPDKKESVHLRSFCAEGTNIALAGFFIFLLLLLFFFIHLSCSTRRAKQKQESNVLLFFPQN
jgi:hypothetical protein